MSSSLLLPFRLLSSNLLDNLKYHFWILSKDFSQSSAKQGTATGLIFGPYPGTGIDFYGTGYRLFFRKRFFKKISKFDRDRKWSKIPVSAVLEITIISRFLINRNLFISTPRQCQLVEIAK